MQVIHAMLRGKVHRVLVHDAEGQVAGLISALDLLRAIAVGRWQPVAAPGGEAPAGP